MLVDLDDTSSWPSDVELWVAEAAARLDESTEYTVDLSISDEDGFRALFSSHLLLVYHCTRLLGHEVSTIQKDGLRTLCAELVSERLATAYARGDVSDEQRALLEQRNVFATGHEDFREGQVCFVLGQGAFEDDPDGCSPLMAAWGGEGMNGGPLGRGPEWLRIGRPSIVVAQIDLSVSARVSPCYPTLPKMFVGHALKTEGRYADVFLRCAVPAQDVLAVWQPGDREYDRHPGLPRD